MANIGLVGDPAWLPPAEVAPGLADLRERQVEAAEAYQAAVGRHREAGWAARREREAHEVAVREATLAGQEPPTPPATPAHTPEHLSALAAAVGAAQRRCEALAELVQAQVRERGEELATPADRRVAAASARVAELEAELAAARAERDGAAAVWSFLERTARDLIGGEPWPAHLADAMAPKPPALGVDELARRMAGMPDEVTPPARPAPSEREPAYIIPGPLW